MPTTDNKMVKAAAGDYTTLALAEAGEQADFVATDVLQRIELFNVADVTGVVIDGSTTDATRHWDIYGTSGGEATMPFSASRYRLTLDQNAININDLHTWLTRFQVSISGAGAARKAIQFNSDAEGSRAVGMLVRNLDGAVANILFSVEIQAVAPATAYIINCVGIGNAASGLGIDVQSNGGASIYLYNTTMVANGTNFNRASGTTTIKNCLGAAKVTADFAGAVTANNNASSDATASGTGSRINQTFTFVNAGTGDYHIGSADAGAKDFGADLSADANFPFSTDFDGAPRGALWDIGATEAASVAANITTTSPYVQPVPMRPQPGGFQQSGGVLSLRFATSAPPSPPSSATVATNGPAAYIQPIPMRAGPPFGFPLAMPFAFAASPPQAQGASLAAPDGVGYLMKIPMRQGPGGFARGQAAIGGMNGSTSNPIPVTPSTAGTGSRIGRMLRTGKL